MLSLGLCNQYDFMLRMLKIVMSNNTRILSELDVVTLEDIFVAITTILSMDKAVRIISSELS